MKVGKLSDMVKGWFIGNFKPTLYETNDIEVAVKEYKKGDYEASHYHKVATEFSVVISGRVLMNGIEYKKGDIIVMEPSESTDFRVLEDNTVNVVVKIPGANNDKYLSGENIISNHEKVLNIVVPMAGRGSRFVNEGYELPKPLIPVNNKPMIEMVLNNLRPKGKHKFIFLCLKEHIDKYEIDTKLKKFSPGCEIIVVDKVTEGAACTVLLAKNLINNSNPLMIANSDQWVDIDINDYLSAMDKFNADGLIMTMWADDPKWSYAKMNKNDEVTEVVEKKVISNEATVGIYNYRHGRDFVEATETMISKNLRVNNEFYVAPAYNEMIEAGKKIVVFNVGKEFDGMYGVGIPSDLKKFEAHPICKKATDF